MHYKWIGAILIITGCLTTGLSIAAQDKKESALHRQLYNSLGFMRSQLAYQLIPLPQLCRQTSVYSRGILRKFFASLSTELEKQIYAQAEDCMAQALRTVPELPGSIKSILHALGRSLGQMDLAGQLKGLDRAMEDCRRKGDQMEQNQQQRLRSFRTLSLCAGAALANLLL